MSTRWSSRLVLIISSGGYHRASIPHASLLPVMLAQLLLKEDMDKYEMVFKVSEEEKNNH